jgi:hypothetical protein
MNWTQVEWVYCAFAGSVIAEVALRHIAFTRHIFPAEIVVGDHIRPYERSNRSCEIVLKVFIVNALVSVCVCVWTEHYLISVSGNLAVQRYEVFLHTVGMYTLPLYSRTCCETSKKGTIKCRLNLQTVYQHSGLNKDTQYERGKIEKIKSINTLHSIFLDTTVSDF